MRDLLLLLLTHQINKEVDIIFQISSIFHFKYLLLDTFYFVASLLGKLSDFLNHLDGVFRHKVGESIFINRKSLLHFLRFSRLNDKLLNQIGSRQFLLFRNFLLINLDISLIQFSEFLITFCLDGLQLLDLSLFHKLDCTFIW